MSEQGVGGNGVQVGGAQGDGGPQQGGGAQGDGGPLQGGGPTAYWTHYHFKCCQTQP